MRLLRLNPSPKSRRLLVVLTGTACAAARAATAMGNPSPHASPSAPPSASPSAYVPAQLLSAARTSPSRVFRVILQGAGAGGETRVVSAVRTHGMSVGHRLGTIAGASAAVTGRQLLQLAAAQGVAAITLDRPVRLTDDSEDGRGGYSSNQQWPYAVEAERGRHQAARGKLPTPPAIAIVDGTGDRPSGVLYAPGNDPFAITVGADDIGDTRRPGNDKAAPFSAWGYTLDGFAKPEISAPGRYMIGPVPDDSTLATTRPGSMVAPGYEQLSGTSFAAPVVSGAAAYLLALHPKWKPDEVKGAIMLAANPEPGATPGSVGVGLVDVADSGEVSKPPNPNAALDTFVRPVPGAGPIQAFDSSAWQAAALKNPNWDSQTGNAEAWDAAAWGSAAWGSAAWGSSTLAQQLASGNAAWGSAAWGSAALADVPPDGP